MSRYHIIVRKLYIITFKIEKNIIDYSLVYVMIKRKDEKN